jgi:hypothetical protein
MANPVPLGMAAEVGAGWTVRVVLVNFDAAAVIMDANEFNDPAPAGKKFVLVTLEAQYNGPKPKSSAFDVTTKVVGQETLVGVSKSDFPVAEPDPLDESKDVFAGGKIRGNQAFTVEVQDLPTLVLYANGGYTDLDIFFALR